MVYSSETECRVRLRDGERARNVPQALRRAFPEGVYGRDLEAAGEGDASAGPGRSGSGGAIRLPVCRQAGEYERNGVANVFMFTEPLAGWRHAEVTDRRTMVDWALQVRDLVDGRYSEAERVTLVMDNLNTHGPWSFYEAFEPAEARRLAERIECVYTPKHGSWLNIAEIELNVLSRQCLDGRIPDKETLVREVAAWQRERNGKQKGVDWQFATADARIKLRRLYPQVRA